MLSKLTGLLSLYLLCSALGAEIRSDLRADGNRAEEDTAVALPGQSSREDKFLSVFQIVKFSNGMCSATDGNMGVCFTEAECTAKGGVATGACASAFGVCCVFKAKTCGGTVSQLVSYVESPNYPNPAPTGMCMFTLPKCDKTICQYKIQYEDVVLSNPAMGDCRNDTLVWSNLDGISMATVPSPLCGTLSGQEMYVTVNSTATDPKLTFNIVSNSAKWRIKITQIACSDTAKLADPGCLTWNTGPSGTFTSFNNQAGNGELINNYCHSHCIKYQEGFCDVSLTSSNFMLGADDSLTFGGRPTTGSTFGTGGSLTWNFTGPYVVPFCSGADNAAMDSGYSINYLLLPCSL